MRHILDRQAPQPDAIRGPCGRPARLHQGSGHALATCVWPALLAALLVGYLGVRASAQPAENYVIGPRDVLHITVFDQPDLSGKYTVDADGTFTFPLIGRIKASGLTIREFEVELKKRLQDGFFKNPQVTVGIEEYRSQRVFVVGEVREPGTYPLTGGMRLIEALARAGPTLPSASGEALVVRAKPGAATDGPVLPGQDVVAEVIRVDIRDLQRGSLSQNVQLFDGDTVFVPRAELVYVFGEVKNPGSYPIRSDTTVLQALSLAGGATERAALNRIRIVRMVKGEKKEIRAKLDDLVQPGDTIIVPERYF
jgi:polysaccharide export outer membrane protein